MHVELSFKNLKSLILDAKKRCDFFLDIFDIKWPAEIDCDTLPDSPDPDICVGNQQEQELNQLANKHSKTEAKCKLTLLNLIPHLACKDNGFRCDITRCIPSTWKCDGYIGKNHILATLSFNSCCLQIAKTVMMKRIVSACTAIGVVKTNFTVAAANASTRTVFVMESEWAKGLFNSKH